MDVKIEGENVIRHLDLTPVSQVIHQQLHALMGVAVSPPGDELKKRCGEACSEILKKYGALRKELRKYDPVSDAKGGFVKHGGLPGLTKPCGHYVKIRQLQRGLKNDLTAFQEECSQSGIKIDRKVDAAANQEIAVLPGCSRISLS